MAKGAQAAITSSGGGLWENGYWSSGDGLRLHYRDYPGPDPISGPGRDPGQDPGHDKVPLICMPGLTRNARDFEDIAAHVAQGRRVITVDFRGRGDSAYAKDPLSYVPLTYAHDMLALFAQTGITRYVACGTSLGGIVTMLLAMIQGEALAGAILNDVGPVIEEAGISRIKSYVGQSGSQPTWVHAARAAQELHGVAFPAWELDDWLRMVKRSHKISDQGRIVADYDGKISEPFRAPGAETAVDLWPAYEALGGRPTLILRGGLSDILSADTAAEMAKRGKAATLVTVPGVGHAPTLDEPDAVAAIDALLARVDRAERKRNA